MYTKTFERVLTARYRKRDRNIEQYCQRRENTLWFYICSFPLPARRHHWLSYLFKASRIPTSAVSETSFKQFTIFAYSHTLSCYLTEKGANTRINQTRSYTRGFIRLLAPSLVLRSAGKKTFYEIAIPERDDTSLQYKRVSWQSELKF